LTLLLGGFAPTASAATPSEVESFAFSSVLTIDGGDDALDADNDGLYTATYNGSSQICETLTVGQGVGTLAITDDDGNGWASYDIDCEVVLDR
jgi:hypothetical protein